MHFEKDKIFFPKGYFFSFSSIDTTKFIDAKTINEVNLMSAPPSLLINENEVIFIPATYKEALQKFAASKGIHISRRFDIWEALTEPFLDTEFDEKHHNDTMISLVINGISNEEVEQIRKKISLAMSVNSFVWEWVYLGQFDYLQWTFLTKKKYWWSMDIALRNYK